MTELKVVTKTNIDGSTYFDILNSYETSDANIVQSKLQIRLSTLKEEWKPDPDFGVPMELIVSNADNPDIVSQIYADEALKVNNVSTVEVVDSAFSPATRYYSTTLTAKTKIGQAITVRL